MDFGGGNVEPFRILCPTCSTKLVVRQLELVGRTVPCPKCKSAIHVVRTGEVAWNPGNVGAIEGGSASGVPSKGSPSANGVPVGGSTGRRVNTVNSEAITKADPGDWDIDQLDQALGKLSHVGGEFGEDGSQDPRSQEAGSQDSILQSRVPEANVPEVNVADKKFAEDARLDREIGEMMPAGAWQSASASARRQWLILGVVAASGCLVVFLGFWAFMKSVGSRVAGVQRGGGAVEVRQGENEPMVEPQVVSGSDPVAAPVEKLEPGVSPKPEVELANGPEFVKEPAANTASLPMTTDDPKGDAVPVVDTVPSVESAPNVESVPNVEMVPNVGLVPNVDLEPKGDMAGEQGDGLPDIFKEFLPVFDRSSQAGWTDLGKEGDRTIDQEISLENALEVFREEYHPAAIALPSWQERSERRVERLRSPAMPLIQRLEWLNRLSGHAISLDWFLMQLTDAGVGVEVALEGEGKTFGELLDQICQEVGCELSDVGEGFLVVRPKAERLTQRLAADGTTSRGALAVGLPEGKDVEIVRMVLDMLGVSQCRYESGKLQWGQDVSAVEQVQVLAALDSVRRMHSDAGLKELSTESKFDFNDPSAWYSAYELVQNRMPMDAMLLEERPVVEILQRVAKGVGVDLLMDWPAVWSHGLHPNRMGLTLLRGRSFLEIAQRIMDDYSLVLVPLGRKTWVLTSEQRRRGMVRLVVVRPVGGVADMMVAMRGLVPRGEDGRSLFRAVEVPGGEGLVMLRVAPPSISQMRDEELRGSFGLGEVKAVQE